MLITFSTGEMHHLELFVTSLDENYSLVLGYDWLARHNLSIDWTETKIMFRELKNPKEKLASSKKIDIRMVSTLMMTKLCKDLGTPTFVISTANLIPLQATAADTLDSIPAKYHDFRDIFSEEKVGTLAPHRPYDLQINVEEGVKPVHGENGKKTQGGNSSIDYSASLEGQSNERGPVLRQLATWLLQVQ